ncbi:MAG: P27 family phage terminase small subunit [Desulfovibrionaceae bacterium]
MAKGRKTTPKPMKVLKGTFRPDRDNPVAPLPSSQGMRAPEWLNRLAVEYFGVLKSRIEEFGLNSSTFTEVVALAASRMAEIDECEDYIRAKGRVYVTQSGKGDALWKSNPAVAQKNEAMRHLHGLLAELGLTPASIAKVNSPKSKEEASPFAQFG